MKRMSLALVVAVLSSCSGGEQWSERAARDRIMLVRHEPQTLGHRRLVYQSASHPDLAHFVSQRGEPDFIAETASDDRRYLILYYLDQRQAFACRTWSGRGTHIEFAGPYGMTAKEAELLQGLKDGSVSTIEPGSNPGELIAR